MKGINFAGRVAKEILRDPLTLFFGLGFPVILLLLLSAIQANIPVSLFEIEELAPGITVFGLSFMTLFSATVVAKDRESAFLERLYTTPMTAADFIVGYTLPFLPISVMQAVICYILAFILGLSFKITVICALMFIIPISLLFVAFGVLFGSILGVKAVGGICGALMTNLTAWFSGVWFDLELVGGAFKKISDALPFVHAVEIERAVLRGEIGNIFPHVWFIIGYTVIISIIAAVLFLKQMKK